MKKLIILLLFISAFVHAQTPSLPVTSTNNIKINNPVQGALSDSLVVWRGAGDKIVRFLPISAIGGGGSQNLQSVLDIGSTYVGNSDLIIQNVSGDNSSTISNSSTLFEITVNTPTGTGLFRFDETPEITSNIGGDISRIILDGTQSRPLFTHNASSTELALLTDLTGGTLTDVTGISTDGITVATSGTTRIVGAQQASSSQRGTANLYSGTGTSTTGGVDQDTFTKELNKKVGQDNTQIKAVATGTNTYAATLSPAITSYIDGTKYFIKFPAANTTASTLNINGLGAKNLTVGGAALQAGIIDTNIWYLLIYNSTTDSFRMTTSNKVNTQTTGDVSKNIANTEFVFNTLATNSEKKLILDFTTFSATGATSEILLNTYTIPANTANFGILNMEIALQFNSPQVASKVIKMYISNSPSFGSVGTELMSATISGTSGGSTLQRTGKFTATGWAVTQRATNTASSYILNSAGFNGANVLDLTQNIYLFFTVTLGNVADSAMINYLYVTNTKL